MNVLLIILIIALPLAGFLVSVLAGKKLRAPIPGLLCTALLFTSALLAASTAWHYFTVYGLESGAYAKLEVIKYTWLEFSPGLSIDMGITLDPISVMMLVVITFISLLVHIYSLGYMKGEERYANYYGYLSLFTFSMLGLVVACNIFQMYMFWELVGVSSYLLIGFYFSKPSAVAASKKAFIVTRFADLGFLVGILILSFYAHTLDFATLIQRLTDSASPYLQEITSDSFMGVSALTWGLVLVFMGGAGKSAMFPLHIWLPDAMEGPTPVSALIHAATMVVAGVFLVARLFPVYALSCPAALGVVTWTGVFSSMFAAVIACTQTDIKRVLAYSTMSQIGYMMFALGVARYDEAHMGGFTASMFHLFTHAMFKALLFLGAGSVIHYVHSNELKDMGGLARKMPVTHIVFLIACLAIAGVPPFAGFFSKEEILTAAMHSSKAVYVLALATAALTAFYMFRLYFSIFWNKPYVSHHDHAHHGEGPFSMMLPLILLAVCSIGAGFIPFGEFVSADGIPKELPFHIDSAILPVALSAAGILVAMLLYRKKSSVPDKMAVGLAAVYKPASRRFYIDEVYQGATKNFMFAVVGGLANWFDKKIINGLLNMSGVATEIFSDRVSNAQSGKVQHYVMWFLLGLVLMSLVFIYI